MGPPTISLLEDESKAKAGDITLNLGYARACRRFSSNTVGRCFSSFNPPSGGDSKSSEPPLAAVGGVKELPESELATGTMHSP